eukprot:CAMPEP_0184976884 /NCGR_PEP_ID=MMETSP1098-20130426/7737_1 /TAXON_ID=89044 /ORGANISM="Spumella elongata, Strain CCAP 955/1" /LENGTH=612 /DNA_ID=CAMNT_0027499823 /DNA_START=180 /DNA_END=2018 /DNA_ORIENTATION=+
MALKNHARQENSYIPQNQLRSKFNKSVRSVEYHGDARKASSDDQHDLPVHVERIEEGPAIVENGGSLVQFKSMMNLNLKISLEDDNDWGKVSDDDDDDNMVNLAQFDKNLIELPPETPQAAGSLNETRTKASSGIQYKSDGMLVVDGMQAGVGAEGIVRLNMRASDRNSLAATTRKLPMRDRLVVLCKLGHGASSAVYKALDLTDMRLVALKMIHVNDRDKRDQFVQELRSLFSMLRENSRRSSIHLPKKNRRPEKYIVDFYDAFSNKEDGIVSLMIEYMDGGSLQDIADQGGCDDEPTLANIAVQALKGLLFLHENLQIHRDLKPGNFLISHRGEVKVADLGILKQLTEPAQRVVGGGVGGGVKSKLALPKTNTFVGTTTYMSPERIDGKDYSFPSDVWAFGLSMITIALGRFPMDTSGGYWTILHGIRDAPPPVLPPQFSSECRDFIAQCMKRNPDERKSVKELLKHPFLRRTVVEDLTYDQSFERGKSELLSVIDAVHAHVTALKEEACTGGRDGDFNGDKLEAYRRMFGNIETSTPLEMLRYLFLNEEKAMEPIAEGAESEPAVQIERRPKVYKPRLVTLAKQLHLPIEKVEFETKRYLSTMVPIQQS